MSYTPTTWKAGDTVTSAKLNKLEQGVAAGGGMTMFEITIIENELDNDSTIYEVQGTASEIFEAMQHGLVAFVEKENNEIVSMSLVTDAFTNGLYSFDTSELSFIAESGNEKPQYQRNQK